MLQLNSRFTPGLLQVWRLCSNCPPQLVALIATLVIEARGETETDVWHAFGRELGLWGWRDTADLFEMVQLPLGASLGVCPLFGVAIGAGVTK